MQHQSEPSTPDTRQRALVRLRRLTRSSVLAAVGATAVIGIVVADEHPGSSRDSTGTTTTHTSTSDTSGTTTPASSSTYSSSTSSTAPTTTTTRPRVTSGGTS
jgi:cytoskeletal protein RodZ